MEYILIFVEITQYGGLPWATQMTRQNEPWTGQMELATDWTEGNSNGLDRVTTK